MSYITTRKYVRPTTKVPFFGAHCDAAPESALAKARDELSAIRNEIGVASTTTMSADRLTVTQTFVWDSKEQQAAYVAANAALVKTLNDGRASYCTAVGITVSTETDEG